MKKLVMPIALLLSMILVYLFTNSFKANTTHFYGITDNKEQSVSFQDAVKILEINVIEGQYVEWGTVLLRAERSNLTIQKNQLNNQIKALNAQQSETNIRVDAEIAVLRSQEKTDLATIDIKISELRSKQQQNRELYRKILGRSPSSNAQDPFQTQINSLLQQRHLISRSINTQIDSLIVKSKASREPINIKKSQVMNNLEEIENQEEQLTIKAEFSGRIGSINHKRGERVSAFQPILSVYSLYPKMVKGYIHENVSNDVKIGQQVWIHSLSAKNKDVAIEGRVESLGNRIVEYPDRLKKNPLVKSWGREVNIQLPMNNTLLLGEKVQVSFSPQRPNTAEAFFKPFGEKARTLFPQSYVDSLKEREVSHAN